MKWGARELSELSDKEIEEVLAQVKLIRKNYEAKRALASDEKRKLMPLGPSEAFLNLEKDLQQEAGKRSVSVRSTELKQGN